MIVGGVSGSTSDKDQRFINVIFDKVVNSLTGKETFYVMKRPGFASNGVVRADHVGTAVRVWASQGSGDKIMSCFGNTNSNLYEGTTSKGAITGKGKFIDEADVGGSPTLLIPSTDSTAWYYQDGGSATKISDADFPGNNSRVITGRFVAMDGYIFIMDTGGRIYNSDLNSVTDWQATSFLSAQMYPDKGIGLARYKDHIVAFGKETIEFFHITDTSAGSPLARTNQAFVRIGCASQYGYSQMEDTIAWISATDRGGCSVYMLDGFQAKRVSTSQIDTQLSILGPDTVRVNCLKLLGKTLILVSSGATTFVYQVEEDIWYQWNCGACLWSDVSVSTSGVWKVYTVSETRTSGKVFVVNPSSFVYQDDSTNYTMTIQTSKIDLDLEYIKFLHRLALIGDKQSNSTPVSLSYSDDDYGTFSSPRTLDMSNTRVFATQLGSFRRRVLKFTNSSNGPFRAEAIELEFSMGQS